MARPVRRGGDQPRLLVSVSMSLDGYTGICGICGKRTRRAPRFVVAVVYVARVCQGYASWCLGVQNQLAYFLTIGTSGDCLNRPLSCPIARSACGPPDRAQFSLKEFYRQNFKFQNSSKTMSKPSDDDPQSDWDCRHARTANSQRPSGR